MKDKEIMKNLEECIGKAVGTLNDSDIDRAIAILRQSMPAARGRQIKNEGNTVNAAVIEYRPLKPLVLNGARLLKREEFEMYRSLIPEAERTWFLDSSANASGRHYYDAVTVYQHDISFGSKQGCYGYRPAIELDPESHELKAGDRIVIKNTEFTVLRNNLALCNSCFMASIYDTRTVEYEKSLIKKRIDKWYRDLVS